MRLLNTIRLSLNQKRVIAQIISAATPKLAAAAISKDSNMISARDVLAKLGAITFSVNSAELTDKGTRLATDENIADESGQLTDVGNELVAGKSAEQPAGPAPDAMDMGGDVGGLGDFGMGESHSNQFALLRELLS